MGRPCLLARVAGLVGGWVREGGEGGRRGLGVGSEGGHERLNRRTEGGETPLRGCAVTPAGRFTPSTK